MLWANSVDDKLIIFFWLFPGNRLWHFMQIVSLGDNFMKCQSLVFGKIISKYHLKFLPSMQSAVFTCLHEVSRFTRTTSVQALPHIVCCTIGLMHAFFKELLNWTKAATKVTLLSCTISKNTLSTCMHLHVLSTLNLRFFLDFRNYNVTGSCFII